MMDLYLKDIIILVDYKKVKTVNVNIIKESLELKGINITSIGKKRKINKKKEDIKLE